MLVSRFSKFLPRASTTFRNLATVIDVKGREIIDSRGNPTVGNKILDFLSTEPNYSF